MNFLVRFISNYKSNIECLIIIKFQIKIKIKLDIIIIIQHYNYISSFLNNKNNWMEIFYIRIFIPLKQSENYNCSVWWHSAKKERLLAKLR